MNCPSCGFEMAQSTGPPILAEGNKNWCARCGVIEYSNLNAAAEAYLCRVCAGPMDRKDLGQGLYERRCAACDGALDRSRTAKVKVTREELVLDRHGNGTWVQVDERVNAERAAAALRPHPPLLSPEIPEALAGNEERPNCLNCGRLLYAAEDTALCDTVRHFSMYCRTCGCVGPAKITEASEVRFVLDKHGNGTWVETKMDTDLPQGHLVAHTEEIRLSDKFTVPPLMVFADRKLSMQAVENVRKYLAAAVAGGTPMVIEPGLTFYQLVDGKWTRIHDPSS